MEDVIHELINGRTLKTDIIFKDHHHKLLDTKWASIDVPTGKNYYNNMNKHKINENKKKTLIPDVHRKEVGQFGMQIHSARDDPTVMILANKSAPKTTTKKKLLTELTPNYYGEDRNIPIRQYPEFQVEYENNRSFTDNGEE